MCVYMYKQLCVILEEHIKCIQDEKSMFNDTALEY